MQPVEELHAKKWTFSQGCFPARLMSLSITICTLGEGRLRRSFHHHLANKDALKSLRRRTPKPPWSLSLHMLSHQTRHCPPVIILSPLQKKALLNWSMQSTTHYGGKEMWY